MVALVLAGCGAGTSEVKQVTELLARTAVSSLGPGAFADVGIDVSGPLSCTSQQSGDAVDVTCSGTSLDDQSVTLTGTVTSLPGGKTASGSFVGTADGKQVFSIDCLGC